MFTSRLVHDHPLELLVVLKQQKILPNWYYATQPKMCEKDQRPTLLNKHSLEMHHMCCDLAGSVGSREH